MNRFPLKTIVFLLCLFAPALYAQTATVQDLTYQLRFKAFCRNDADIVDVQQIDRPIHFALTIQPDGSANQVQAFHHMLSAGYEVYVTLEMIREAGGENFQIRLAPWRKVPGQHDISFGTGFVEQKTPSPLPRMGVAVAETINAENGSYCTLTATITSK